jgi:hypothetical protein
VDAVSRSHALVFFSALLGSVAWFGWGVPRADRTPAVALDETPAAQGLSPRAAHAAHSPPWELLPRDTELAVTLGVTQARGTFLEPWLSAPDRAVAGLGSLDALCGYDPTRDVETLAAAVSSLNAPPAKLAIAAQGRFDSARLERCIQRVVERRGGTLGTQPVASYRLYFDASARAQTGIALSPGRPVLVGSRSEFPKLIAVAEGRSESLGSDPVHRRLHRELGVDGWLSVTWRVTGAELAAHVGVPEAAEEWRSVTGLGVRVAGSERPSLRAVVLCGSGCAALAPSLRRLQQGLEQSLPEPQRRTLERLTAALRPGALRFELELAPPELAGWVQQLTAGAPGISGYTGGRSGERPPVR